MKIFDKLIDFLVHKIAEKVFIQISTVSVNPNDVIVVTVAQDRPSPGALVEIEDVLKMTFPNNRIVVMGRDVALEIAQMQSGEDKDVNLSKTCAWQCHGRTSEICQACAQYKSQEIE